MKTLYYIVIQYLFIQQPLLMGVHRGSYSLYNKHANKHS